MLSRRRFLGCSGIGMMAIPAGCQLPWATPSAAEDPTCRNQSSQQPDPGPNRNQMLGYPVNMNDPPAEFLAWCRRLHERGIDAFAYNNVGNPFKKSPFPFNTHDFERATIEEFGQLLKFPGDDAWGFLSHSGTDSNMHGMYMGRTILKGKTGQLPRVYFTQEAHYSVQILADLLGLDRITVNTLPNGGMDMADLAARLKKNADVPALLVATVGTTFKGAIDDLDGIRTAVQGHPSYVHLDAALFGGYLPYTEGASEVAYRNGSESAGRYDSIAISCHKFFGFASPAGLYITTQSNYDNFNDLFSRIHNPEYIHHVPGTITCSRDAVKPAQFYYYATSSARARQAVDAQRMLQNTGYLLHQLTSRFPRLQAVRANPLSNTVYFRHPGERMVRKYSLATMNLTVDGQPEKFAHVIVMPHVSVDVIDGFLNDLQDHHS